MTAGKRAVLAALALAGVGLAGPWVPGAPMSGDAGAPPNPMQDAGATRILDAAPPPKILDAAPPPKIVDAAPPPKVVDAAPPPKIVDAAPPPRVQDAGLLPPAPRRPRPIGPKVTPPSTPPPPPPSRR